MIKKLFLYVGMGIIIMLTALHGSEWIKSFVELKAYHANDKAYYYESIAFEAKLKMYIEETFESALDQEGRYGTYEKIVESPNYGFYMVMDQHQKVNGYSNLSRYDGEPLVGYDPIKRKDFFRSKIEADSYHVGFDRREEAEVLVESRYIKKVLEEMMRSYPQVEAFGVSISNDLREGDVFYIIYQDLQQEMAAKELQMHRLSNWLIVELGIVMLMVMGITKKKIKIKPIKYVIEWLTNKKCYQVFFVGVFSCYLLGSVLIAWKLLDAVKTNHERILYLVGIIMLLWQGIMLYILMLWGKNITYLSNTLHDMGLGIGDGGRKVPTQKLVFTQMIEGITLLSDTMYEKAKETGKNEQLKTELLLGVSRNLCTPVLEVSSALKRLGTMEIEDEIAKEYIGIVTERTRRFEALLKELIEMPKEMEEGIEVHIEAIEISEMVRTVIAQYEEKLQSIPLEVCMEGCVPTAVKGDNQFIWRILENLIGNVIKYAMPYSRVYIHTEETAGYGMLVIKNMCKERIEREAKELKERFVRGDQSRNTEGFGLGLAIVEKLVTLQKGEMVLVVDGDLFKVTILLPLNK